MGLILNCLNEANFGKPINCIKIIDICCKRIRFIKLMSFSHSKHVGLCGPNIVADIDDIERYGHAITTAKAIMETNCFLTDRNYLVCGIYNQPLPTLEAKINIDDSISQLSYLLFSNRISFKVAIEEIPQEFNINKQAILRFIQDNS